MSTKELERIFMELTTENFLDTTTHVFRYIY